MDFKFCPHCGASLATAPGAGFCPACGGALGGGDKKRGHPFLLAGLALLLGGALLAGLLWFFKALPTPLLASDSSWLCFTAESADATVGLEAVGNAPAVALEISPDGRVWNDWGQPRVAYLRQPGDKLYVRAKSANRSFVNLDERKRKNDYHRFAISGKVAASGNIMSLVDKEGKRLSLEGMDFAFAFLFKDCAGLTAAPRLPATKLAKGCYALMFMNCAGLTHAPELPATELAKGCYARMFKNCAKLTRAPELPATELADRCYYAMFEYCANLTAAPAIPAAATGREDSGIETMFVFCDGIKDKPEK